MEKLKKIEEEILKIFTEEFYTSITDILIISKDEFLNNFIHRMNIILKAYHNNLINEIRKNKNLFSNQIKRIIKQYYIPTKNLCEKELKNIKYSDKLTSYEKHCDLNKEPIHYCKGKFITVKNSQNEIKLVICSKCHNVYKIDQIIMYCEYHDCDFYSSGKYNISKDNLKPATWENYHCPVMLNQQMTCNKCNNNLWLNNKNNLFCKKCNKEFDPYNINWICVLCHKTFKSGAKQYNKFEFLSIKNSVKNALVNEITIKPNKLPCNCFSNPFKVNFKHNEYCDGFLLYGNLLNNSIIVCSKCKSFASVQKFMWTCPKCYLHFSCLNTRTFTLCQKEKYEKDEFKFDFNDNDYEDLLNNFQGDFDLDDDFNLEKNDLNFNKFLNKKDINNDKNDSLTGSTGISSYKQFDNKKNYPIRIYKAVNENLNDNENQEEENETSFNYLNNKYNSLMNKNQIHNLKKRILNIRDVSNSNNSMKSIGKYNSFTDKKILEIQVYEVTKPPGNSLNNEEINKKNILKSNEKKENKKIIKTILPYNYLPKETNNKKLCLKQEKKPFIFKEEDFKVITQIGEGTFGKIFLVEDPNKQYYCMKKMYTNTKKGLEAIEKEYEIISNNKHMNIMSIIGISKKIFDNTTYGIYVLMEVAKTDWEKEINQRYLIKNYYSEKELLNILKQLVSALSFLEKNNIGHRDIKAQNILCFENNIYKIADFGEAKKFIYEKDIISTLRGTELYMSPILFYSLHNRIFKVKHNPYKSDVFSLGMCLLFASTLKLKYLVNIRNCNYDLEVMNYITSLINGKYSNKFISLLCKMISLNEEDRPNFIELENIIMKY